MAIYVKLPIPNLQGDAGEGVAPGGTTGQVLAKQSNADYDTEWVDQTGGGGGVTDHGALTGLGDDDHTQYHNDARGDVRYYTKAQSDTNFEPNNANIQSHIASTSNPHSVTKAQVGLSNVDNTSDANKPISTATQTALDLKANAATFDLQDAYTNSTSPEVTTDSTRGALTVRRGSAADSDPIYEGQNSAGTTVFSVTAEGQITVTGNNGVEHPGLKVNNTNLAGYCAINARADDGEVIQIAALNSGGAANQFGMWLANQFGLYAKRTLNIITGTAGAEIKFASGAGGSQIAKFAGDGSFSGILDALFGTGEDGPGTINSNVALTRAQYYTNLTVTSSGILRPSGFPVFVNGVLTVGASGQITANGANGGNGGASATAGTAGAAQAANELAGSLIAGVGATGVNGAGAQAANVAAATCLVSATAGNGGAGGAGAGGAGGSSRSGTTSTYRPAAQTPWNVGFLTSVTQKNAGHSAPGGSSGAGTGAAAGAGGGGGGSGGAAMVIYCKELINDGAIRALGGNGGNGGNASNVNAGGGGGGGGGTGGLITIIAGKVTTLGTISVAGGSGGTGGTGNGTGLAGSNGTSGGAGKYRVYNMSTGSWTIS